MTETRPPRAAADPAARLAQEFYELGGARLCHTLALALGNIAEELRGNTDPEKFLTSEECLGLATALLAYVPEEPAPPPAPDDPQVAQARARIAGVLDGAKPTAQPWVDPAAGKGPLL